MCFCLKVLSCKMCPYFVVVALSIILYNFMKSLTVTFDKDELLKKQFFKRNEKAAKCFMVGTDS